MKAKFASGIIPGICMVVLASLIGSCTQEKDFYDPDNNPLPNENEYFGFETRKDMNLNVNYNTPVKGLIEVYAENPMETNAAGDFVKKENAEALFKIYTDAEGKFNGKMELPTSLDSVYVYTAAWGLPRSLGAKIENGTVNLNLVPAETKAVVTRGYDFGAKCPYLLNTDENLYSLAPWGSYGALDSYTDATGIHKFITGTTTIGNETVDGFASRLMDILITNNPSHDNSSLVKGEGSANLKLKEEAEVRVAFVNRDASFNNTFGYYYYDAAQAGNNINPERLKKYVIFPNVITAVNTGNGTRQILKLGDKVQLKYFGPNGTDEPKDKFPANTVIGWFIYPNGYVMPEYATEEAKDKIFPALLVSSDKKNSDTGQNSFMTLHDVRTNKYIIGVEDGINKSYCDLLFYAEATPGDAIEGGHPEVPDTEIPEEKPDAVEKKNGTLAFEDIWPAGGDYDMNDVIVQYTRAVYFNKDNVVTKIVDIFTPENKPNSAGLTDAFAYQIDEGQFGKVTMSNPVSEVEAETSSIIVFDNPVPYLQQQFTITREFPGTAGFNKQDLKAYNPYVIPAYVKGADSRIEVHLPKYKPTSKINAKLVGTGDDAFYIDKDGMYPFAIDIPIGGFRATTERVRIDKEYPDFTTWVESKGEKATGWYYNKK